MRPRGGGAGRAFVLEHPATVALGVALLGLIAGPLGEPALAAAVVLTAAVSGTPRRGAVLLVIVVAAAALAQARAAALDGSALGPRLGHVVRVQAPLLEAPRETRFGWRAAVDLDGERAMVQARGTAPHLSAGDVVALRGLLRAPGPREGWMRPKGIHAVLRADSVRATGTRRGGVSGALDAVRRRAQAALTEHVPAAEGALLRGMVLGDDAALGVADRDRLRRAGLGHLVAASGANVALLAALALAACSLLGVGLRTRLLTTAVLIALYVPLAGAGPSIRRAGVMGLAVVIASLATRPGDRRHAVLLAAVVTLALDPRSLADPAWQLSFAAVVGIAVLSAPLLGPLRRVGAPAWVAEGAALTLAATIATVPVSAAAFGTLSLAGLPANVAVAPLVGPTTWIGLVGALLAQAWPAGGAWVAWPAALPLAAVLGVGRAAAGLPAAQIQVGVAVALALAAALSLVILWPPARRPAWRAAPVLALVLIAVVALGRAHPPAPPPPGALRLAFLDIGQGDATLVQSGRHAMLVDSGPADGAVTDRLRHLGVSRLDVLVGTHAQADHIGGADRVLRTLPVGEVLDGRDGVREREGDGMARAAAAAGVRIVPARAGQRITIGAATAEVLSPPLREGPPVPGADPNQRAIVIRLTGAGVRLLLTADAESDVLAPLDPGPVDILKVSHHGSVDAGLPSLLQRLRPRVAVIEVGRGNTYGHPTPATLAALSQAGVRMLRTDRDGTVVVDVRGGRMRVHTHS